MSRVITFSVHFPKNHVRAGQPTYFFEQILKGLSIPEYWKWFDEANNGKDTVDLIRNFNYIISNIKSHTIRGGNRWEVGDKFSPRVWSGKPYASKQIIIAPDIEIKKIWDIKIEGYSIWINKETISRIGDTGNVKIRELVKNDGLSLIDFWHWFPYKKAKIFTGQIICWNENVNY